ncbi:hypothetical protein E2K93_05295 [Thalassotalea sp. HSM 43]|uniref:hypothetical protein n=1 Tax=Thalassotalea sp. HSM 43 TaxID=2552945 RepID=UPI0010802021|nr:hypothetical protein [Thalassotalea sp. HSM 43]QBY03830.1 hypothetical protein E2K93_05295 [Thalassotalea sp. HSM 43]
MSFLKALLLAIVATLVITWALGVSLIELFNVSLYVEQQQIESWTAVSVAALIAVIVAIVTAAILVSVFGFVIFVLLSLFVALAALGIGLFWPVLLVALAIHLLTRERNVAGQQT